MTLPSERRNLVVRILAVVSILALIYLLVHQRSLQNEARQLTEERALAKQEADLLRSLVALDTLLLNDDYHLAQETTTQLKSSVEDSAILELLTTHEALISHMQKNWSKSQSRPSLPAFAASRPTTGPTVVPDASMEEDSLLTLQDKLDSMAFALQKAEMFADKLQVQVDENTAGNYLTFKSIQGNSVYYVGDIQGGKANGTGVGLLSTGSRYEGEWKNNKKHGNGIFQWQDGALYNGEYRNDQRHGAGTYQWPNGERFVGGWEKDVRSGQGTFYDAKGKVVASGLWRDDELVKRKKGK